MSPYMRIHLVKTQHARWSSSSSGQCFRWKEKPACSHPRCEISVFEIPTLQREEIYNRSANLLLLRLLLSNRLSALLHDIDVMKLVVTRHRVHELRLWYLPDLNIPIKHFLCEEDHTHV
eukprot:XP_001709855.1 Hypothetical protein GL50803_20970 [Giardia lamblia ATCC 50803]